MAGEREGGGARTARPPGGADDRGRDPPRRRGDGARGRRRRDLRLPQPAGRRHHRHDRVEDELPPRRARRARGGGGPAGARRAHDHPRRDRRARRGRAPRRARHADAGGRVSRCAWVPEADPLYVAYHDEEWGVPSRDERHLFEMLVLEGAQAGLSWSTILRKRDGYRRAFAGFDAGRVARLGPEDVERLMADSGVVRNRLKIESAIANARAVLELDGGLPDLLWSFVGGEPRRNGWRALAEIPAETAG